MNGFSPLNFWEYAFTVQTALLEASFKQPVLYRQEREWALQGKLLKAMPGGGSEDYVLHRIGHVSAAARAFFEQHQPLTMLSAIPVFEAVEMRLLVEWVYHFQILEHEVWKVHNRTHPVPLKTWAAPDSYRDELAKMVEGDPALSQVIIMMGSLPRLVRHQMEGIIVQQICGQLDAVHEQRHPQMG